MGNDPDEDEPTLGLEAAYSVESPGDNRRLYAAWATSYEADFIAAHRYVYHQRVAEIFVDRAVGCSGPVLDVGCGTGIVGAELTRLGVGTIDGIDISPEMLIEAGRKAHGDRLVYRHLIEADLTDHVPIASDTYDGIVSAGTFTHGHLGPEAIDELLRVGAPGARCVIGVNSDHFGRLGFAPRLDELRQAAIIIDYSLVDVAIYDDPERVTPDDVAHVLVFDVGR